MMTPEELADNIVALVHRLRGSVTHGDLISRLSTEDLRGDIYYGIDELNICLFAGLSQLLNDASHILMHEEPRRIEVRPVHYLCHLIDGSPIPAKMPIAKRPPKGGYKEMHFASVGFYPAGDKP